MDLSPAVLLFYRQIVGGQPPGEPLPLHRSINIGADDVARRERHSPMPQQRSNAVPVEPVARLPAYPDGNHRIAMVRVLLHLIRDHGKKQAMLARWR